MNITFYIFIKVKINKIIIFHIIYYLINYDLKKIFNKYFKKYLINIKLIFFTNIFCIL